MKASTAFVLALGVAISAASDEKTTLTAKAKTTAVIEPTLRPESSEEFFKNDYPHDDAHGHQFKTKYPYPQVQSSDTFDADYVKDENNNKADGEAWDNMLKHGRAIKNALEEADRLKKALAEAKEELQRLQDKLADQAKDVEDAKEALAKAKAEAEAAQPEETTTPKPVGKELANNTTAPSAGEALEPIDLETAIKKVNDEVDDLEKCKEELRIAKEKLEQLHKEAAEAEAVMQEKEEAKKAAEHAEALAKQEEDRLEVVVDKEKAEYKTAQQRHEDAKAELEAMIKDLKKAEEKLRRFRGEAPQKEHKSGAFSSKALAVTVGALALLGFVW